MTIECAILGFLGREPLAGYDLKKRIQDSPAMPWSGNNNQVYKALSAMLAEGLVTSELHHQEGLPSRKVYTITEAGRAALCQWLAAPPEMMEPKKPFLAQISLSGALGPRKVDGLLGEYAHMLRAQLDRHPEIQRDANDFETALRIMVDDNIRTSYQMELEWTERARAAIEAYVQADIGGDLSASRKEGVMKMNYRRIEKPGVTYLHYIAQAERPETMEATQFVADCIEQRVNRVMLDAQALPEAFFHLRTGLAGEVLQKLNQYRVKAALVLNGETARGKFGDMLIEANRGGMFRSFENTMQAEQWLAEGEEK